MLFIIPGLVWLKYPILCNLCVFILSWVISAFMSANLWNPYDTNRETDDVNREGMEAFGIVKKHGFVDYMKRFFGLGFLWTAEIVTQSLFMNVVFSRTLHYVDWEDEPMIDHAEYDKERLSLVCSDGGLTQSMTQMLINVSFILTVIIEWNGTTRKKYVSKTLVPVIILSVGGFFAIWNDDKTRPNVMSVLLCLLWIFMKAVRLSYIKKIQALHEYTLTPSRMIGMICQSMVPLLIVSFMIFELPVMINNTHLVNIEHSTEYEFTVDIVKMAFVIILYTALLYSGTSLLLINGNSVDYCQWIQIKDVLLNSACIYAIRHGEVITKTLKIHQFIGIAVFGIGCVLYQILYYNRIIYKLRKRENHFTKTVSFKYPKDNMSPVPVKKNYEEKAKEYLAMEIFKNLKQRTK
jgi:hypothetical protein